MLPHPFTAQKATEKAHGHHPTPPKEATQMPIAPLSGSDVAAAKLLAQAAAAAAASPREQPPPDEVLPSSNRSSLIIDMLEPPHLEDLTNARGLNDDKDDPFVPPPPPRSSMAPPPRNDSLQNDHLVPPPPPRASLTPPPRSSLAPRVSRKEGVELQVPNPLSIKNNVADSGLRGRAQTSSASNQEASPGPYGC